jgi:hypothetical protein
MRARELYYLRLIIYRRIDLEKLVLKIKRNSQYFIAT